MKRPVLQFAFGLTCVGLVAFFVGCLGSPSQKVSPDERVTQGPFVEAYLEYAGLDNRWAGPQPAILHVDARGTDLKAPAKINLRHEMSALDGDKTSEPKDVVPGPEVAPRAPASSGWSIEEARVRMDSLSASIESEPSSFQGCLWPIRVRLVREGGQVVEKVGCRSSVGWASFMSASFSGFLEKR